MERHQGILTAKAMKKPSISSHCTVLLMGVLSSSLIVEGEDTGGGVVGQYQAQDGYQHDEAARLGVDEELGGGVDARLAIGDRVAPERDQGSTSAPASSPRRRRRGTDPPP